MSAVIKVQEATTSATVQHILGLNAGSIAKLTFTNLFTAVFVDTVEDITAPGVYRVKKENPLPDNSSLEYSAILCLRAGADLYLLAMSHSGSAAYGFKNNGNTFKGWKMLT